MMDTVSEVLRYGARAAGRAEMIKFLEGKPLTRSQSIRAMCYACMGYYGDEGGCDCEIPNCPLYPYQPYSKNKMKDDAEGE